MADFFQNAPFPTLTRLEPEDHTPAEPLAEQLTRLARRTPIFLILPCHAAELGAPALARIIRALRSATFLSALIVGLDAATAADVTRARRLFSKLPFPVRLLPTHSPAARAALDTLSHAGLPAGSPGKGRNLWLSIGAALALHQTAQPAILATHDCDIRNYTAGLLQRLCYPLARRDLGFSFCKGFSARYSDRLHGRVMRLLFTPLLRALRAALHNPPPLVFLDSFRYALAGETALLSTLAAKLPIPSDWSVETGILNAVFHTCHPSEIVQAEVAPRFDHKHQKLCPRDPSRGLHRMARDITAALLRIALPPPDPPGPALLRRVLLHFEIESAAALRASAALAAFNSLRHDTRMERLAARTFLLAASEAAAAAAKGLPHPQPLPPHAEAARLCPPLPGLLLEAATPC